MPRAKGWVEKLLGEMQRQDIATWRANTRAELQDLLKSDKRGLILSMIHKFKAIEKDQQYPRQHLCLYRGKSDKRGLIPVDDPTSSKRSKRTAIPATTSMSLSRKRICGL
jgi:type I site-specific restriction-modification system R (restriction) subunit